MKKLFSLLLAVITVLTLSACQEELNSITVEVELQNGEVVTYEVEYEPETEKNLLEVIEVELEVSYTNTDFGAFLTAIEDIEASEGNYVAFYVNGEMSVTGIEETEFKDGDIFKFMLISYEIHTDTITVEVEEFDGTIESTVIEVDLTSDLNLFEVIDAELEVFATDSEYGKMIYGFEGLSTSYGNYIAFYKNDEMSMTGVEATQYSDGDVFKFKVEWWDTTAQAVFEAIDLFLMNQVENYVNPTTIDYNVLAALELLDIEGNYLSASDVETYFEGATLDTYADYFKRVLIYKAMDIDATGLTQDLKDYFATGPYGQTAYYTLALYNLDADYVESSLETTIFDFYASNTPFDSGLDTGGISLIALSTVGDSPSISEINDYVVWVKDIQLPSGGVTTRDMVWGDTTYPGTENAATMSQVIMALSSYNITPYGEDFTIEGNNLVTRLIEFQNEDGSFDYLFGDENADLMFSTPQAFLALVTVYTQMNTFEAVNPYIID